MSYTIKLKSTSIQMGKTTVVNKVVNPTANNSSDFNLESLNVSKNLNLKYLNALTGVLHTDISGNVVSKLIDTSAMSDGSITSVKLASNIDLSGIPTVATAPNGTSTTQIATTEFVKTAIDAVLGGGSLSTTLDSLSELAAAIGNEADFVTKIKPLRDVLANVQPTENAGYTVNAGFFHVTADLLTAGDFYLTDKIRHIIEVPSKIILPPITKEGVVYSLINKSDDVIIIKTSNPSELIFNSLVTPVDGDDEFELGTNQCLEFISIFSNKSGLYSWQASYY